MNREQTRIKNSMLFTLFVSVSLGHFNLSAQDKPAAGTASSANDSKAADSTSNKVAPVPTPNAGASAPDANIPSETAADRFKALREKRLEAAWAYQKEEERKREIIEKQRAEQEELSRKAALEEYVDEKEAFLAKFKKNESATVTPTPTPSILDQLDEIKAQQAAEDEEIVDDAQTKEEVQPGAEAQINLEDY